MTLFLFLFLIIGFLVWFGVFLICGIGQGISYIRHEAVKSSMHKEGRELRKIYTSNTGETMIYDYSLVVGTPEGEEQFQRYVDFKERYGVAYSGPA